MEWKDDLRSLAPDDFFREVQCKIRGGLDARYVLVSLDFDNFNYINDLFGYETGDEVLRRISGQFEQCLKQDEYYSRVHADHFVFWVRGEAPSAIVELFMRLTDVKQILADLLPLHYHLVCSGGIVHADQPEDTILALLDKANYARKRAKGNHESTFLYYDEHLAQQVEWQKIITLSMESALQEQEFEMYLQPKILLQTGQVVGAEALARWNNREHGFIVPDRFIPIMEQNGFVRQLDFYMLEQACIFLRRTQTEGLPLLPVSVNFSKLHTRSSNFPSRVKELVDRYEIPARLIEVEFTETALSENFEAMVETVTGLKQQGFRVSLDDFGSAYSSLGQLKDLPLDVIKIDKAFLQSSANTDRGRVIIAKVVELIKSLRMVTVMEGVETKDQVDCLQKFSCDLGQGYFYARPMPVEDYIRFLQTSDSLQEVERPQPRSEEGNSYLSAIPQEFLLDNWELYALGQNIDMGLMKGFLDETITVQYINDKALDYFGYSRREFRELLCNSVAALVHPEDLGRLWQDIRWLAEKGEPIGFQTRAIRKDGGVVVLKGRVSSVVDSQGRPIGLYAFQDVTEELERTRGLQLKLEDKIAELERLVTKERESREALRLSEERYRLIVEQSDDIVFEWDFETDEILFADKFEEQIGRKPDIDAVSTNPEVRANIHPDDLGVFEDWVRNTYRQPNRIDAEYRLKTGSGGYHWLHCRSTPIMDCEGKPTRAVGVFSNITQQKAEMDTLTRQSQLDPLTRLYNKEETRRRIEAYLSEQPDRASAFFIIDVDNFKGVNDTLGHQMGDTLLVEVSQKIKKLFRETDIVGRIGGDEFAVFTCGFPEERDVMRKAEQLLQALCSVYFGANTRYSVTGSVGISRFPLHGQTFEELYHLADIALYESKNHGKDRYTIYSSNMTGLLQDNRTPVEWSERFLTGYFEDDFTYNVFEMLYETKDMETSIGRVLELTGKRFQVDRVYIFRHSEDGLYTSNTFEWCAPGIEPEIDTLQNLSTDDLSQYLAAYSREGLLCCSDLSVMDAMTQATLSRQGIKSFLHCAIYDAGEMTGFIGFDVCSQQRAWRGDELATLGYLSRILSVFLRKSQVAQALVESNQNYEELIRNLNGYVYVIDSDTCELLYVNNATLAEGMNLGDQCYRAAFGREQPCENCPVTKLTADKPYASAEIYSVKIDGWVNSAASKLHWGGRENAALVCCTDISKYKS